MSEDKVVEAMIEQGHRLLGQGLYEEAVRSFTACLAAVPDLPQAYQGRAKARFLLEDWAQAALDFARAKELNPRDWESWLGWGMSLAMDGRLYEAMDILKRMLSRNPQFVSARIQLGLLHYQMHQVEEGKKQMQIALGDRPTLAERKMIENILKERKSRDEKRPQRADSEVPRRRSRRDPLADTLKNLIQRFNRNQDKEEPKL